MKSRRLMGSPQSDDHTLPHFCGNGVVHQSKLAVDVRVGSLASPPHAHNVRSSSEADQAKAFAADHDVISSTVNAWKPTSPGGLSMRIR